MPVARAMQPATAPRRARPAAALGLALAVAVASLAAAPLGAQILSVTVLEEESGLPVAGAAVGLLDSVGATRAEGITSQAGRRGLTFPSAGTWRVRVRRIGFEPFVSEPLRLAAGETRAITLRVPARRVVLPTVAVTETLGRDRCRTPGQEATRLGVLWEEIRTALTLSELTREGSPPLEVVTFERSLTPGGVVRREVAQPPRVGRGRPFAARPADELAERGYMRDEPGGTEYFAPDERVLLAESFVRDHCFGLARGGGREASGVRTEGMIGMQFVPLPGRRRGDIAGTIWVDSATAELRHIDYWFADERLPTAARGPGRSGGHIAFERLASGEWIVDAWRLRMPKFGNPSGSQRVGLNLLEYIEVGGTARAAGWGDAIAGAGRTGESGPSVPGSIVGVVYDSLLGAPLAGASVWVRRADLDDSASVELVGRGDSARVAPPIREAFTDGEGRFRLDSVPPGIHVVGFGRADIDTLGLGASEPEPSEDARAPVRAMAPVRVASAAEARLDLALRSWATLARGCTPPDSSRLGRAAAASTAGPSAPRADTTRTGVLVGMVRDADTQAPLANAVALVTWTEVGDVTARQLRGRLRTVEAWTDSTGVYRACGVPVGQPVSVQAFAENVTSGVVAAALDVDRRAARRDLLVSLADTGGGLVGRATIAGVVRDSTGGPVADAVVTVEGAAGDGARTDAQGRFTLRDLPSGSRLVHARKVGFAPVQRAVDLRSGRTQSVSFALERATVLAEVNVRATAVRPSVRLAEAAERRERGFGYHFAGEELRRMSETRSIFQRVPGLSILQLPPPPFFVVPKIKGASGEWTPWLVVMRERSCVPTVYLDGQRLPAEFLPTLSNAWFEAVEVYTRPSQAPQQFSFVDNDCAVILIWTDQAR